LLCPSGTTSILEALMPDRKLKIFLRMNHHSGGAGLAAFQVAPHLM
jgi:hypothetical protein